MTSDVGETSAVPPPPSPLALAGLAAIKGRIESLLAQSRSVTKYRGVSIKASAVNRFDSYICIQSRTVFIGVSSTPEVGVLAIFELHCKCTSDYD